MIRRWILATAINMRTLQHFLMAVMLSIGCWPLAGCAAVVGTDKAPNEVWEKLARGEQQNLIVALDDSAILVQVAAMNRAKAILFDDNDTMRFKAERYAAIKRDVMSTMPSGKVKILKNYDMLPLMFLRFHSTAALEALLAHPSVVKVYEDSQENLMHGNSRP
jgi:hypothetical protein